MQAKYEINLDRLLKQIAATSFNTSTKKKERPPALQNVNWMDSLTLTIGYLKKKEGNQTETILIFSPKSRRVIELSYAFGFIALVDSQNIRPDLVQPANFILNRVRKMFVDSA